MVGTDCTRKCKPPRSSSGIDDADADDLREDFKGLPLERRIGCEDPRESVGRRKVSPGDATNEGVSVGEGDRGEETGKGTLLVSAMVSLEATLGGEYRPPMVIGAVKDRKFVVSMLKRVKSFSS